VYDINRSYGQYLLCEFIIPREVYRDHFSLNSDRTREYSLDLIMCFTNLLVGILLFSSTRVHFLSQCDPRYCVVDFSERIENIFEINSGQAHLEFRFTNGQRYDLGIRQRNEV
jgi:hypothetical protein